MGLLSRFLKRTKKTLQPVFTSSGWISIIQESSPGAWQRNVTVNRDSVLAHHAVFACMTLIASDISKLRLRLMERDANDVWSEVDNPAFSPVMRKPNGYQNRIQFWESWILSKLSRGNTYVLKERDERNVVTALHVLDPTRVRPLIAEDGSVFYDLMDDDLSGTEARSAVPARELIHDRMNCLFHPLIGISPLFAAGISATQGVEAQAASTWFFANRGMPGGILSAPGFINKETADRLKEAFDANFQGKNVGKVAVLGDGLKYERLPFSAEESQLIENLKWTGEMVCSTFHVPPYKVGIGTMPAYNNIQALNVEYYSQALQKLIEDAEVCIDEGIGLARPLGSAFDVDGLLRMDTVSQVTAIKEAVGAGVMAPNEGRWKLDLKSKTGGDTPYLQEQNFSLAALAKRDAMDNPWGARQSTPPSGSPPATPPADMPAAMTGDNASKTIEAIEKAWANVA